ncbi:hypothetical protein Q3G72_022261 [Acer saccharum]|nr:hypothetical protein Q3G72_022261 [Acer saccharum]
MVDQKKTTSTCLSKTSVLYIVDSQATTLEKRRRFALLIILLTGENQCALVSLQTYKTELCSNSSTSIE